MVRDELVSTIIPVYNRPAMLQQAVESVLAQSYRPIEIIIVDDESTDETPVAAAGLAASHPEAVRVLRKSNGGPGAARQAGLQIAQGQFIQYLDSDDRLLPGKFSSQVAGLNDNPDCGVSYGKTRCYRFGEEHPPEEAWKRTGERIATMFPAFLQSRWWDTSTPLYRRTVCDAAGPWTNLRNEEDWEFDCRVAALGGRLHYVNEFVSEQCRHGGDRLSQRGSSDPSKLKDRAQAHRLILQHACRAGISHDTPEMGHFARELFLLARQCGAAGLAAEANMLFDRARAASAPTRRRGLDFVAYRAAAGILGWTLTGRLSCGLDTLRR